jgi:hypothetical protein
VAVERPIDVPASGLAELTVTLDDAGNERGVDGFRVYIVGGQLRPVVIEVGGLRRWDPVRLEPASVRALRENYEHLADDPVARIGQAVEKNSPVHLVTAAALVPPERRGDAVDLLVDAIEGARAIDWAIYGALHYLTGVQLCRDPDAWRAWWPRVRETFYRVEEQAKRVRDPDRPEFG